MATLVEAAGDIHDFLSAAIRDSGPPLWPLDTPIIYENLPGQKPSSVEDPYVRPFILNASGTQVSLSGVDGRSCWRWEGLFIVQVFSPVGKGLNDAYQRIMVLQNAFEGWRSPNGVWFSNSGMEEIGPRDQWYQVNFKTDFTYDEIK